MVALLFYLAALCFIGALGTFLAPTSFHVNFLFANATLALSVYILTIGYAAKNFKGFSWIGIFHLFSLSLVIIHFLYPFLVRFYSEIEGNMFVWMYPEVAPKASAISLASYAAFCFAYFKAKPHRGITSPQKPVAVIRQDVLKWLPSLMAIISNRVSGFTILHAFTHKK